MRLTWAAEREKMLSDADVCSQYGVGLDKETGAIGEVRESWRTGVVRESVMGDVSVVGAIDVRGSGIIEAGTMGEVTCVIGDVKVAGAMGVKTSVGVVVVIGTVP